MTASLWPTVEDIMFPAEEKPITILKEQQHFAQIIDEAIRCHIQTDNANISLMISGPNHHRETVVVKISQADSSHWYPLKASGVFNNGKEYEIASAEQLKDFLKRTFHSDKCLGILKRIITDSY